MELTDRLEAGILLARRLPECKDRKDVMVLAIPRGGVEVGFAMSQELGCCLDVVVSKKIPFPGQPELAIGAVCNQAVSLDVPFISRNGVGDAYVRKEIRRIKTAVKNRYGKLASGKDFPDLAGKNRNSD